MDPEAVGARLLDRNDRKLSAGARSSLALQLAKWPSNAGTSPPATMCFDIFFARTRRKVMSHFDCESYKDTEIAARSTRIVAGASLRLAATGSADLLKVVGNHSTEAAVAFHSPGNLARRGAASLTRHGADRGARLLRARSMAARAKGVITSKPRRFGWRPSFDRPSFMPSFPS